MRLALALVLLAMPAWAAPVLPACIAAVTDETTSRGHQRFTFDASGALLSRDVLDDAGNLHTSNRYTWTNDALTIVSTWPGQSETKFQQGPTGKAQHLRNGNPSTATFRLGAHGELLHVVDDAERTELVWKGTFAEAKPRPFFEGLYIGAVDHVLLPRHLAERGIFTRMRPLSFSGTVTITGPDFHARTERAVGTYRDGKLQTSIVSQRVTTYTWRGEELVRERAVVSGRELSTIDYTWQSGRLARSVLRSNDDVRDVRYTYAAGILRSVETTLGNAKETLHERVDLRDCK